MGFHNKCNTTRYFGKRCVQIVGHLLLLWWKTSWRLSVDPHNIHKVSSLSNGTSDICWSNWIFKKQIKLPLRFHLWIVLSLLCLSVWLTWYVCLTDVACLSAWLSLSDYNLVCMYVCLTWQVYLYAWLGMSVCLTWPVCLTWYALSVCLPDLACLFVCLTWSVHDLACLSA